MQVRLLVEFWEAKRLAAADIVGNRKRTKNSSMPPLQPSTYFPPFFKLLVSIQITTCSKIATSCLRMHCLRSSN